MVARVFEMSVLNTNNQTLSENPTLQVIHNHITVQEAAEITGYNTLYLRLILRAGKLDAMKIGQIWLVDWHLCKHTCTVNYGLLLY